MGPLGGRLAAAADSAAHSFTCGQVSFTCAVIKSAFAIPSPTTCSLSWQCRPLSRPDYHDTAQKGADCQPSQLPLRTIRLAALPHRFTVATLSYGFVKANAAASTHHLHPCSACCRTCRSKPVLPTSIGLSTINPCCNSCVVLQRHRNGRQSCLMQQTDELACQSNDDVIVVVVHRPANVHAQDRQPE